MFRVVPILLILGLVGFVMGAQPNDPEGVDGEQTQRQPYIKKVLRSWYTDTFPMKFEVGSIATAIVVGDGQSYIGLYAYDSLGNCVARDDQNFPAARDDLAISWQPTQTEQYWIEVTNLGRMSNVYELAIR